MDIQPEPTLIELVRYDNWMNQQLLAICMEVDETKRGDRVWYRSPET